LLSDVRVLEIVSLRLLGSVFHSCVLGLRRSLDRFGFGEGDAALAVVELEEADLAVGLGDHERAVRLSK